MGRVPITVMGYRCEKCLHEWIPRGEGEPVICPNCKSARWNRPRKAMTTYDDFKVLVKKTLVGKTLTWTEIRTSAKLPQLFPNNQWVRKLESDIGLERKKDVHGIIHWSLKADAATEPIKPAKLNTKAAGRKQV